MSIDAFIEMTNRAGSPANFRCHFRGAVADNGHRNAIFTRIGGGIFLDSRRRFDRRQDRGKKSWSEPEYGTRRVASGMGDALDYLIGIRPYGGAAENSEDC